MHLDTSRSALEELRNALYKFKTYLLTYLLMACCIAYRLDGFVVEFISLFWLRELNHIQYKTALLPTFKVVHGNAP